MREAGRLSMPGAPKTGVRKQWTRRRMDYLRVVVEASRPRRGRRPGFAPKSFSWAVLGYALSDEPLPKAKQEAISDKLVGLTLSN